MVAAPASGRVAAASLLPAASVSAAGLALAGCDDRDCGCRAAGSDWRRGMVVPAARARADAYRGHCHSRRLPRRRHPPQRRLRPRRLRRRRLRPWPRRRHPPTHRHPRRSPRRAGDGCSGTDQAPAGATPGRRTSRSQRRSTAAGGPPAHRAVVGACRHAARKLFTNGARRAAAIGHGWRGRCAPPGRRLGRRPNCALLGGKMGDGGSVI